MFNSLRLKEITSLSAKAKVVLFRSRLKTQFLITPVEEVQQFWVR